MRSLAVVGLAWAVGCATTPAVELVTLSDTSDPATSADATTGNVASSEPGSPSTESDATSEPATSAPVVETSTDEVTSVPVVSSTTTSSVPVVTTAPATSEASAASSATSGEASSAVTTEVATSEPVDVPELTMENVVEVFRSLSVGYDGDGGYRFQVVEGLDGFYGRHNVDNPRVPLFEPPLIEWMNGCDGSKAVIRVPAGMCATVSGIVKQVTQLDDTNECYPDLVVPVCSNATDSSHRSHSGEPTNDEPLEVRVFSYTDDECDDEAHVWGVIFYEGACGTD